MHQNEQECINIYKVIGVDTIKGENVIALQRGETIQKKVELN